MGVMTRWRCDGCGLVDADFECQARQVRAGTSKETKGTQAPWVRTFLCEPCTKQAIRSDDPPRQVTPLPGYKPRHDPPAPETVEQRLGDDWGQR